MTNPDCPALNDKGRSCTGQLELIYKSKNGKIQIFECDEHAHRWQLSGTDQWGPWFEGPTFEPSWFDKREFEFRRWRENKANSPFLDTLKDVWAAFKSFLPSISPGGAAELPYSAGDNFEDLEPVEHTIHSRAGRRKKKKDKPSFAEVVEKHV